jgi:hypothetical protein
VHHVPRPVSGEFGGRNYVEDGGGCREIGERRRRHRHEQLQEYGAFAIAVAELGSTGRSVRRVPRQMRMDGRSTVMIVVMVGVRVHERRPDGRPLQGTIT